MNAPVDSVSLEALRRQEARTVAEIEVRQAVYDAAERALANEKSYLQLLRKDIAALSAGAQ